MATELVRAMKDLEKLTLHEGFNALPVPATYCIKFSSTDAPEKRSWQSSIGIVLSGCKQIEFGHEVLRIQSGSYVLTPYDLPVVSRIARASPRTPYLCLLLEISFAEFSEVDALLGAPPEGSGPADKESPFAVGKTNPAILESTRRFLALAQRSDDAKVLGAAIRREILYFILKTPEAARLRSFLRSGKNVSVIASEISADLAKNFDAAVAAKRLGLSRAVFYRQFKSVTGLSPVQYQKRLRLLEARRLMIFENENAQQAALTVGFNNTSQFSREYVRMFGRPPARDAKRLRRSPRPES